MIWGRVADAQWATEVRVVLHWGDIIIIEVLLAAILLVEIVTLVRHW